MTREKQQESPHIRRHLGEVSARLVRHPFLPPPSARRGGGGMKKVPRRRAEVTSSPRERSCEFGVRLLSRFPRLLCASSNLRLSPLLPTRIITPLRRLPPQTKHYVVNA